MKRFLVVIGFFFCLGSSLFSKYSLVFVKLDNEAEYKRFVSYGYDLESASRTKDGLAVILNSQEIALLDKLKFIYEVIVDDYEAYLSNKISYEYEKWEYPKPLGFSLGSMSGFYKLNEIYWQFDQMEDSYPQFFIEKDTIGYSWENRPILAYSFGNPSPNVPKILITCLHHSREPGTITSVVFFLFKILEAGKLGEPEASFLLSNRQIWIIPVVNPDGYFYNETRYPNGGGLWRKNRRKLNDSTFGVDLNRNYGPFEFWNADNNGSSTKPQQETYRGESPFSEPETQAIRFFCMQHNFTLALNFHTYGGMLIYPFAALNRETPDSSFYRGFSRYINSFNGYYFGKDKETVGYPTRGNSDDWMYTEDSLKGKIVAMTPEAGYQFDGFWPNPNRIIPIAIENFQLIRNWIWSAEANIRPTDFFYQFDTIRNIGSIKISLQNIGLADYNTSIPLRITSLSNEYPFDSTIAVSALGSTKDTSLIIQLPIPKSNFINGTEVNFNVQIVQDGISRNDTFGVVLYDYKIVDLMDRQWWDFSKGIWDFELDQINGRYLLTDSPYRNYPDSTEDVLLLRQPFKLNYNNAQLAILSQWLIEPFYDFATVEISTDGGSQWINIRSKLSTPASGNQFGKQKLGTFGFAGIFPYQNLQLFDLKPYLGKNILLKFTLLSDRGKNYNGWEISELQFRLYPIVNFGNYQSNYASQLDLLKVKYPNGVVETLELPNNFNLKYYKVYNILGMKVNETYPVGNDLIEIPKLPIGIYLLQLVGQNNIMKFTKIIVR